MSEIELTFDDRVRLLLQHLGIERAHCAASVASDWRGLLTCPDDRLLSLALVSPMGFDADALRSIESRLLVIAADQGGVAQAVRLGIPTLPQATHCILSDYLAVGWSDIAADRTLDILSALEHFLDNQDTVGEADDLNLPSGQGEAGGITYQIRGSGPPLVLFPLWLAPAQWEPLIPQLSERYCTITLSGAHLGMAQNLEERLQTGFLSVFRSLIDEMELQPGDAVLDVGCGTGSFDRWMVGRIGNGLQVTGVDINPYILREAQALVNQAGLEESITFAEGEADRLTFPDHHFDAVISFTMLEEVDADRFLAEMVRVTKPGGRVGAVVRARDLPSVVNLPLSPQLKMKVETPGATGGGVGAYGCADASLYPRCLKAGLTQFKTFPQWWARVGLPLNQRWESEILSFLSEEETVEWHAAVAKAASEGTAFVSAALHCVYGTKPA